MPEYISQNLTTIIVAIVSLFAGIGIGIGISINYFKINNKNSNNDNSAKVTQKGNLVGGDQAGRDIKK
jgi:MFS superfamily sulfate permease-like transporter